MGSGLDFYGRSFTEHQLVLLLLTSPNWDQWTHHMFRDAQTEHQTQWVVQCLTDISQDWDTYTILDKPDSLRPNTWQFTVLTHRRTVAPLCLWTVAHTDQVPGHQQKLEGRIQLLAMIQDIVQCVLRAQTPTGCESCSLLALSECQTHCKTLNDKHRACQCCLLPGGLVLQL